jgi:hypothetical protein
MSVTEVAVAEAPVAEAPEAVTEFATPRVSKRTRAHLTLVAPLSPDRASRGTFVLIVTGILALALLTMLVINTSLAQGSFTVQTLRGEFQALQEQEQALLEEVAAASAPIALEYQARELGMVPSSTPVFISVPDGRVLGKPRPAPGVASRTTARITATSTFSTDVANLPTTFAEAKGYGAAGNAVVAGSGEDELWKDLPPRALVAPDQPLVVVSESGPDDQLSAELVVN